MVALRRRPRAQRALVTVEMPKPEHFDRVAVLSVSWSEATGNFAFSTRLVKGCAWGFLECEPWQYAGSIYIGFRMAGFSVKDSWSATVLAPHVRHPPRDRRHH